MVLVLGDGKSLVFFLVSPLLYMWHMCNLVSISDELVHEKEKFKAISDELDQTFAEMSGY